MGVSHLTRQRTACVCFSFEAGWLFREGEEETGWWLLAAAAAVSAATVPGSHQSVSVKPSGWQTSQ